MTAVLVTRNLGRRFGGLQAVSGLDLDIEEGAIHGVIGPNGAGKTTVFNLISQTLPPTSGLVVMDGLTLNGLTQDRVAAAGITRTYQNIRLFRNMTALENILVGMHLHLKSHWWDAVLCARLAREDERRAQEEARQLLQFVGLRGRGDMLARNLSYGEQRRLEIGRALAARPRVLMLDEPTAGMNPHETTAMMDFIRRVRTTYGLTLVLIEHQMRVVMTLSDKVTVLDHGVKIAEGAPHVVQQDPLVIGAYLGRRKATPLAARNDG